MFYFIALSDSWWKDTHRKCLFLQNNNFNISFYFLEVLIMLFVPVILEPLYRYWRIGVPLFIVFLFCFNFSSVKSYLSNIISVTVEIINAVTYKKLRFALSIYHWNDPEGCKLWYIADISFSLSISWIQKFHT